MKPHSFQRGEQVQIQDLNKGCFSLHHIGSPDPGFVVVDAGASAAGSGGAMGALGGSGGKRAMSLDAAMTAEDLQRAISTTRGEQKALRLRNGVGRELTAATSNGVATEASPSEHHGQARPMSKGTKLPKSRWQPTLLRLLGGTSALALAGPTSLSAYFVASMLTTRRTHPRHGDHNKKFYLDGLLP